jgi:hypothetical protein
MKPLLPSMPLRSSLRSRRVAVAVALLLAVLAAFIPLQAEGRMRYVRAPYPGRGTSPSLERTIRATWPPHLHRQALNVAWCESRGRASARNGQYKGHFQMGRAEWRKYGSGSPFNPIGNSAAAYRYYRAAGKSWRPWQCQP